jgi:hypothetical protein
MIEHGSLDLTDVYNWSQVADGLQKAKLTAIDTRVPTDKSSPAEIVIFPVEVWQ